MTELSPAAQAVWDAYEKAECDPYVIDPRRAELAAALRAVADQVVPMALCPHNDDFVCVRHQLHAIAYELEAQL